jgi:hypothetical protein
MSNKLGVVLGCTAVAVLVLLLIWRWCLCDGDIFCYLSQHVFVINNR